MSQEITYSETELLQGLKAYDEQAYNYLYDHYSKALFTVIFHLIPQQEIAEDVLQEAFIKIWQNIKLYDSVKGRLYTWMLNIARNQAIDRTRSKDFTKQAKTTTLVENVYNDGNSVNNKIEDVGLKKTLESLPPENRKLLELAYFQGFTQEEIAKILHIPLGTVKTRIRATLMHLRKIVEK